MTVRRHDPFLREAFRGIIAQQGAIPTGGKHEISLRTPGAAARLRADLRRARQPDGRVAAPLLAAGVHLGRADGPAAQGKAVVRGDRRLPRQARPRRGARPALRASRHLVGMGPDRGARHPLLLPRLALRHRGKVPRDAVRERGDMPGARRLAAGLQDAGIWRPGLRLSGAARQRALVPALRHHRPGPRGRCRAARHAAVGRLRGRHGARLQLAAALGKHRRSLSPPDAAPGDQRRPVRGRADAGEAAGSAGTGRHWACATT